MLETLDAPAVRRWSVAAADALEAARAEIDDLNVFPVPDGDTGTNLSLTMHAAADALAGDEALTAGAALKVLARGAVLGARGNSGVIVSQILRGLSDGVDGVEHCDADRLQKALRLAADQAYSAVADPVEGTILTVMRAAAEGAAAAAGAAVREGGNPLAAVVGGASAAAAEALRHTPEQLPVLARAGVVDAGGKGLVVLLDALAEVVTGRAVPHQTRREPRPRLLLEAAREAGSLDFQYEVQYLLDAPEESVDRLRADLGRLGDCLVIVGTGDGVWNVHVHVDDVGAAIEAGVEAGRPRRITVVRFADEFAPPAVPHEHRTGTAVVAVAPGEGFAHLFEAEGVVVVDGGPGGDSPSTTDVLNAVRATKAAAVVLLPNASQISGVAETAAEEARNEGIDVAVVPTRSPVQGLAAVAVHDPERRFGDDTIAMAEAAAATRYAEVTIALREALTTVGMCREGDVLGLIDGEVVVIGTTVEKVAMDVLDRLLGVGGELLTIVRGEDCPRSLAEALRKHVAQSAPYIEVAGYDGLQPHYPLIIGLE